MTVRRQTLIAGVIAGLCAQAVPAVAQAELGAYLAGRQAAVANDFAAGAQYFGTALQADPGDPVLL